MSFRHLAPLRPAIGHAGRSSKLPICSPQIELTRTLQLSCTDALRVRVFLSRHSVGQRQQSTSTSPGIPRRRPRGTGPNRPPPPPPLRDFLRQRLNEALTLLYNSFSRKSLKRAYRESPFELILALGVLACLGGIFIYLAFVYITYVQGPFFSQYPPEIADSLRKALYYTNMKPNPKRALKYYKQALAQCEEMQLDPFLDQVLGIRIQVSYWLEKIGNTPNAISVLEHLASDCQRWVDLFEKKMAEGTLPRDGVVKVPKTPASQEKGEGGENKEEQEMVELENLWHKRRRILAKLVATQVKLGELYSSINEPENSRDRLVSAVETSLKEFRRRTTQGVKEAEGPWLSNTELGASLESLGKSHETNSQFQLAVPLFFHALRLCDSPCHRPVIMNNLATSFAQHPAVPVLLAPQEDPTSDGSTKSFTRAELLESAHNWAKNAYTHAKDVKGDERTPECDEACAVSLVNLGQISAMMGNDAAARRWYQKALDMSKSIEFADGLAQAQEGLDRLSALATK